jgi:hypothetical protein
MASPQLEAHSKYRIFQQKAVPPHFNIAVRKHKNVFFLGDAVANEVVWCR